MRLMFAIVLSPFVLSAVILFFHLVPNASNVLSNIFWSWLGDISIFPMTIDFIQKCCSHEMVGMEEVFRTYFSLMVYGALDAILMGCCIFVLKSAFITIRDVTGKTAVYRSYIFVFSYMENLLSLAGVILYAAIQPMFGIGSEFVGTLLKGSVSIILLVVGIVKIWTAGKKYKARSYYSDYEERRESFLLKMLISILINAFQAIAVVNIIALLMDFGRMWRAGAHWLPMIVWLLCSFILAYLCNLIARKTR